VLRHIVYSIIGHERTHPNKEVNHEENVESQIDLLRSTLRPFLTRFDVGTETVNVSMNK